MISLAFIGAGAMGEALLRGLLAAKVYAPDEIVIFDADSTRLQAVASEFGVGAGSDHASMARDAEVLVLAVKPQVVNAALSTLRDVLNPNQTLISIAAGVTSSQL